MYDLDLLFYYYIILLHTQIYSSFYIILYIFN